MKRDDTRAGRELESGIGRFGRAGSFLSGLLPGLLSVTMLLAIAPRVAADHHESGGGADAMQKMMDEQLDRIPTGEEGVNRIMGELSERLTLTPEQQKDIRPTVEESVAAMEKSRDQIRAGEITPMAMAMQMQMAGQKAAVKIEPLLTEEQVVSYKEMRQEQRRQMMQAMQQQRSSGGMGGAPAGGGSQ